MMIRLRRNFEKGSRLCGFISVCMEIVYFVEILGIF